MTNKTLPPILGTGTGAAPAPAPLMTAMLWDLDGTLNICEQRSKFNWDDITGCTEVMRNHQPNWPLISMANAMQAHCQPTAHNLIVTARPERYRTVTEWWLERYKVKYSGLYMRPDDNVQPDAEVKRAILHELRKKYNIWYVVEDRAKVVEMWREEGVLCLQCAEGNY